AVSGAAQLGAEAMPDVARWPLKPNVGIETVWIARDDFEPLPAQSRYHLARRQNEHLAVGRAPHLRHISVGQAVGDGVGFESALGVSRQPPVFSAYPQLSLRVFIKRQKAIGVDAFRVGFVEDLEALTVVANQPVRRRQPEVAVAGLQNSVDGVLRQAVVGVQYFEAILCNNGRG